MIDKRDKFPVLEVNEEDIDTSFYNIFDSDLNIIIDERKVPVYFTGSEIWAMLSQDIGKQKDVKNPPANWRDKNNRLFFPLILIKKMDFNPTQEKYIFRKDGYNDIFVGADLATDQKTGKRIDPKFKNQVYDLYYLSVPKWVTFNYEVTVYSTYVTDMNLIKEYILNRFPTYSYIKVNQHEFQLVLDSVGNESTEESTIDDDRLVKYNFTFTLYGYLVQKSDMKVSRSFDTIMVGENTYQQNQGESFDQFIKRKLYNPDSTLNPAFLSQPSSYNSNYDPSMSNVTSSTSTLTINKDSHTVNSLTVPYTFIINSNGPVQNNEHIRLFLNGTFYNKDVSYTINYSTGVVTWIDSDITLVIGDKFVIFYQPV